MSRAEISSITGAATEKPLIPDSREAVAITHLLKKPPIGGMPTSESEAIVKQIIVTGIFFPIPLRPATSRIPSWKMKTPAARKRQPFDAAWAIR